MSLRRTQELFCVLKCSLAYSVGVYELANVFGEPSAEDGSKVGRELGRRYVYFFGVVLRAPGELGWFADHGSPAHSAAFLASSAWITSAISRGVRLLNRSRAVW